ncbi:hypothetical protein C2G38_2033294 [Gigaspora rosea]|uniref:Peptidase S1 domain-containing protein n=1 Tax=Gigaspora rosea TaxID=44941 RepID=A0A397VS68_9GLOM|nr:hypothetical protein C2G38_2033294 [Gigaspora rosea]
MKTIYFLIILLLSLQSYPIYAEQHHPLAKLWEVDDTEVPNLLERERTLIAIDKNLSSILEQDDFISSFGGTYIDIFENHIVVNTVDSSKVDDLLALPQIKPNEDFLSFKEANNSMSLLKSNFEQILHQADLIRPPLVVIYTDMVDNNNVIYVPNITSYTEFLDATKPFDPIVIEINPSASQNLAQSRRNINLIEVKVLGGDGLHNDQAGMCSAGFWVIDIDEQGNGQKDFYIITAGHCYEPGVWTHQPWGYNGPPLLIGTMVFNSSNYDFGVIFLEGKDVVPTFIIRNDEADQYKELIITGGESVSSHDVHICKSGYKTHFTCANVFGVNGILVTLDGKISYDLIISGLRSDVGDSGGPVLSFQDLHSVVVHGIHTNGAGIAQSIDKIFNELNKHYKNLTLYLG